MYYKFTSYTVIKIKSVNLQENYDTLLIYRTNNVHVHRLYVIAISRSFSQDSETLPEPKHYNPSQNANPKIKKYQPYF